MNTDQVTCIIFNGKVHSVFKIHVIKDTAHHTKSTRELFGLETEKWGNQSV